MKIHGMFLSTEYIIWRSMKARCNNPSNTRYSSYGGRGIKVCERWRGFENFYADMGPRPSIKHTLDRINNDGDYEPRNCRWATPRQQINNRRTIRLIEFNGETLCLNEWARKLGMHKSSLQKRLRNWSLERAMSESRKKHRPALLRTCENASAKPQQQSEQTAVSPAGQRGKE